MGAIHFSVDKELLSAICSILPIDVFVETGTFNGETASMAASIFKEVITIELSSTQFEISKIKLEKFENIRMIMGNSPDVLSSIRSKIKDRNVIYWLDAHWCGATTAGVEYECPLIDELAAIGSLNDNSVVLIDDARLFLSPPPHPHHPGRWPALLEVVRNLEALSLRHRLRIIDDVMIFYPPQVESRILNYGRSRGTDLHKLNKIAASAAQLVQERNILREHLKKASAHTEHTKINKKSKSLNENIDNRSECLFVHHLEAMGINKVLDIGSNNGQFVSKIRELGYKGTVYSVDPQESAYSQLLRNSQSDPRWIPLARQGAGARRGFLDLNISENSFSSSILSVHANHLRAEPTTRTVARERIFVNRASDLLRSEIMKSIEAVKIDVQGYEAEVLDGLNSIISNVNLIMLEMSNVDCYVGAPSMLELHSRLVEDFGFCCASLEPAFYDEKQGVAQQYDGIYFRSNKFTPAINQKNDKTITIITSIGGKIQRLRRDKTDVGFKWQKFCVDSWKAFSKNIVSFSENSSHLYDIEWRQVSERPSIAHLFREMESLGMKGSHYIFINSDIALTNNFKKIIENLDNKTIYYGSRTEVDVVSEKSENIILGEAFNLGFDYFIMPAEFVSFVNSEKLIPEDFRIGEPWWDYMIPLIALARGFPLKKFPNSPALALHYRHEARYDREKWVENGRIFVEFSQNLLSSNDCRAWSLLSQIVPQPPDGKVHLGKLGPLICASLP